MPQHEHHFVPEPIAMAELMGLRQPNTYTDLKLAKRIAVGMPWRSVATVCKHIDPTGRRFTIFDVVTRPTYHRKKQKNEPLSKDDSEKLWQIARVFLEAVRQYGDKNDAVAFLFRSHPLLEQRRPIDVAKETVAGADLVMKLLAEAEAGVAV